MVVLYTPTRKREGEKGKGRATAFSREKDTGLEKDRCLVLKWKAAAGRTPLNDHHFYENLLLQPTRWIVNVAPNLLVYYSDFG